MLARTSRWILGSLAFAALVMSTMPAAAHHRDPVIVEPEVEPETLPVPLFLTTVDGMGAYQHASSTKPLSIPLGLDDNATNSTSGDARVSFNWGAQDSVCSPYSSCGNRQAYGEARHAGRDFQIEPRDTFDGLLRFNYQYYETLPQPVYYAGDWIGEIWVSLSINDIPWGTNLHFLTKKGGSVDMHLMFGRSSACEELEDPNATQACRDNETAALPELWSQDVQLNIKVNLRGPALLDASLSRNVQITFLTEGSSYVLFPEMPPAAEPEMVEVVAVATIEEGDIPVDEAIEATYADTDADGEPDQLQFVPGPGLPLFLAATLVAGAWIRRRG